MKEPFLKDDWEFEITENIKSYGFKIDIYKNNTIVASEGGFGSPRIARAWAKYYILNENFGIEA